MFDFPTSIKDAFTVIKTGARVLSALSPKEKETRGFMETIPKFDFGSDLKSTSLQMRNMDPIQQLPPSIQNAYRYMANNVARDVNLRQIQESSMPARRTAKIASVKPTITASDSTIRLGGKQTIRTSGVMKL
tara:strand:- start:67 stop:462 length:396 start_codon:yes stop_codon:yes gene_type:complete